MKCIIKEKKQPLHYKICFGLLFLLFISFSVSGLYFIILYIIARGYETRCYKKKYLKRAKDERERERERVKERKRASSNGDHVMD